MYPYPIGRVYLFFSKMGALWTITNHASSSTLVILARSSSVLYVIKYYEVVNCTNIGRALDITFFDKPFKGSAIGFVYRKMLTACSQILDF